MLNTQDYIKKEVNELQIEQHNVLAQELISVIDDNRLLSKLEKRKN